MNVPETQTKRPSVLETPMETRLNKAIDNRISRENAFIEEIIPLLNQAIASLDNYDPSTARSAIDLTQEQLREIVFKLNDVNNINTDKATSIANIVRDSHLLRTPQTPQQPQVPQEAGPPQTAQLPQAQPQPQAQPAQISPLPGKNNVPPLAPVKLTPGRRPGPGGRRTRRRRKGKSKRIV